MHIDLETFFEVNLDLLCVADTSGRFIRLNRSWSETLGYSISELEGREFLDFVHPEDRDRTMEALGRLRGQEAVLNFVNRFRHVDGSYRHIEWRSQPRGELIYAAARDITERIRQETSLRESRELLDLFFRQSLDGFFFMMLDEPVEWGPDTDKEATLDYVIGHQRVTKINAAMLEQYRAQESDFLGLTPADFFAHDIEHGRTVWRRFFDTGTLHVDTREQKLDGTPMIIEGDYICLYDSRGRITGHFGIQRDVSFEREATSRLRDAEERYRQLAENIDEVFILRDGEEVLYVGPAYERIWGVPCSDCMDRPDAFVESIHPDDRDRVRHHYRDGAGAFDIEYRILRPDGSIRWIWEKSFPVPPGDDPADSVRRSAAVAQDVTERKLLEDRLRDASIRDPLTNLYNRRHVFERLEPLVEKARRGGLVFALAIVDLDHFKKINDSKGHLAGDFVLKSFASLLAGDIRSYDLAGRFGGEEFVVVYQDTDKHGALEMIKRTLSTVRDQVFRFQGQQIHLTASCGIADSTEIPSPTANDIVALADDRLYRAKAGGRDQSVV